MTSIRVVRAQLEAEVIGFDAEVLSARECADLVGQAASIEKLAATMKVLAAVRVAKTDLWQGQGDRSPADWLARTCGTSVHAAAEQLGLGRKLRERPKTAEAMRKGKLSPEQAKSVADAAEADPSCEDGLLDLAEQAPLKELKDRAQKARAAAEDDGKRQRRIHARRSLRTYLDGDGAFNLHLRGTAADGARIEGVLKPLGEWMFRTGRAIGVRDSFEARAYDSFLALINRYATGTDRRADATDAGSSEQPPEGSGAPDGQTARDPVSSSPPDRSTSGRSPHPGPAPGPSPASTATPAAAVSPGITEADLPDASRPGAPPGPPGPSGCDPPPEPQPFAPPPVPSAPDRLPGGVNTKLIMRIDWTAYHRGHTIAGETSEIAGLGQVPVATIREIMATGDPFLAAVVTKGRDVVSVAHLGRGLNAHQRTALEATDLACSNIACNQTVAIQIDHRTPWAEHPETKLDNQDPLCPTDHGKKTHHGWALTPGTGRRPFVPPDHPDHPDRSETTETAETAETGTTGRHRPVRPRSAPVGTTTASPRGSDQQVVEQPKLC